MSKATQALFSVNDADIRLLRVFRKVVDCGGFSAAETELNIGRAAISQHMADLERRLGMRLCRRGRAGFMLTAEGRATYEASQRLFAGLEQFRSEINAARGRLHGALEIGITDNLVTMPRMRVTHSLRRLKLEAPDVRINIRMIPPNEIERGVLDGRLHVGVVADRRKLPGLDRYPLYSEQCQLYCGKDHVLIRTPDSAITPDLLRRQDAVTPTEAQTTPETAALFERLTPTATATDREGVAFLILTGCYLGFLPTHYARRWVDAGDMRAILPGQFHYSQEFHAVTWRDAPANLVLDRFMVLLHQSEHD